MPKWADQPFEMIAVMSNAYLNEGIADLDTIISFPMLMDLDREGQRVLGDPAPTYPRNVVIAQDGTVAHFDTDLSLDAAEAAIEAALGVDRR